MMNYEGWKSHNTKRKVRNEWGFCIMANYEHDEQHGGENWVFRNELMKEHAE